MKKILIYSGYGTSEYCLKELTGYLEKKCHSYELITASQIRANYLEKNPNVVLCFGGGFDLGFLSSLDQQGCNNIRKFVKSGGAYLGICAGAYFACKCLEFDINGPLVVKGERLGLFNGTAIGPINKNFAYNSDDFTLAMKLKISNGEEVYAYLNGGPYFEQSDKNFNTLLTYSGCGKDMLECGEKVAVLETKFGMGKCVLSGVHFEVSAEGLNLDNENLRKNVYPFLISNKFDIGDLIFKLFE